MIQRHFRNTLQYNKKTAENPGRYGEVEVAGAFDGVYAVLDSGGGWFMGFVLSLFRFSPLCNVQYMCVCGSVRFGGVMLGVSFVVNMIPFSLNPVQFEASILAPPIALNANVP